MSHITTSKFEQAISEQSWVLEILTCKFKVLHLRLWYVFHRETGKKSPEKNPTSTNMFWHLQVRGKCVKKVRQK